MKICTNLNSNKKYHEKVNQKNENKKKFALFTVTKCFEIAQRLFVLFCCGRMCFCLIMFKNTRFFPSTSHCV